jgi:hypothetical protein
MLRAHACRRGERRGDRREDGVVREEEGERGDFGG